MELVFLGTGAAYPHLHRGASSVLLKQDNGQYWMFDCGEGTQLQIRKVKVKTGRLTKIFITHLHGDHLYGLPGFIDTYQENFKADNNQKVLEIYGPKGLRKYLRTCLELSRSELQVRLVVHELVPVPEQYPSHWKEWPVDHSVSDPCHPMELPGCDIEADEHLVWNLCEDERFLVKASYITHRVPCFGFVIQEKTQPGKLDPEKLKSRGIPPGPLYSKLKAGECIESPGGEKITPEEVLGPSRPGRKVVILGDTSDSVQMEKLSSNASVVVHETTLDNELKESCILKGHSTPEMAGSFARRVGAKRLVITHFSQRYKPLNKECKDNEWSVDKLLLQSREAFQSVEVLAAEDFLTVPVPQGDCV